MARGRRLVIGGALLYLWWRARRSERGAPPTLPSEPIPLPQPSPVQLADLVVSVFNASGAVTGRMAFQVVGGRLVRPGTEAGMPVRDGDSVEVSMRLTNGTEQPIEVEVTGGLYHADSGKKEANLWRNRDPFVAVVAEPHTTTQATLIGIIQPRDFDPSEHDVTLLIDLRPKQELPLRYLAERILIYVPS